MTVPSLARTKVNWLIKARWFIALGEAAFLALASLVVFDGLNLPCLIIVVTLHSLSNLLVSSATVRLLVESSHLQGTILVLDVLFTSLLLFFFGGASNPLSMVFLAYVALAAVLLDGLWTWALSMLATTCYIGLFFWYQPLPGFAVGHHSHSPSGFSLHLYGMLLSFMFIAALMSGILVRMRRELEFLSKEVTERAAQQEKLALAAEISGTTAHELGTPLASMLLLIDEISDTARSQGWWHTHFDALRAEFARCRTVVHRLIHASGEIVGEAPSVFSIEDLFANMCARFPSSLRKRITTQIEGAPFTFFLPKEETAFVLFGLVKNGLEASGAEEQVSVSAQIRDAEVELKVEDRGPGIPEVILQRLGTPFNSSKQHGMGLGLFLARLFSDRLGGGFSIGTGASGGTMVTLTLPRVLPGGSQATSMAVPARE